MMTKTLALAGLSAIALSATAAWAEIEIRDAKDRAEGDVTEDFDVVAPWFFRRPLARCAGGGDAADGAKEKESDRVHHVGNVGVQALHARVGVQRLREA